MKLIRSFDLPDAWLRVLDTIWREGEEFRVERGSELALTKKIAVAVEVERPETRPLIHERAPCDMTFVYTYTLEYLMLDGRRPGEAYTYGERLRRPVDQIEAVVRRYREARYDRQNTMVIRLPQDINLRDPPCLIVVDTEILGDELNFYAYFRSWDAYSGFPANLASLQLLKEEMADKIGCAPGKTVAFSKNLHIYERQFKLVEDLLKPARPKP